MNEVLVPLAPVEVIDRLAILRLRLECETLPEISADLARQKETLQHLASGMLPQHHLLASLAEELYQARADLQSLEGDLRACEARGEFDVPFIALTQAYLASMDALDALRNTIAQHLETVAVRPM